MFGSLGRAPPRVRATRPGGHSDRLAGLVLSPGRIRQSLVDPPNYANSVACLENTLSSYGNMQDARIHYRSQVN
jgi:hypothetical protein